MKLLRFCALLPAVYFVLTVSVLGQQTATPATTEGDFTAKNFKFRSGEALDNLRLHYTTLGKPARDAQGRVTNAVLILHGTGGSGSQFLQPIFAGELFGPGQLLDAARYYIVLPDGIGHGKSSKPSDGLHARFPQYHYDDMVLGHYRLLTEGLGVNHLRLIFGTSMGCMHSFPAQGGSKYLLMQPWEGGTMLIQTCIDTVILLGVAISGAAQQKPDFSGEWILNRQASTLSPGADAVQSGVVRIEHREPTFRCKGTFVSGSNPFEYEYELLSDGREVVGTQHGPPTVSSLRWDGDALLVTWRSQRSDGEVKISFRYELLDAGRRLRATEQVRGTDHDQDNIWIFERR